MVAENVSIVAAIELLDEQLVDAQESSTRYQDFTKRRFYTPPEIARGPLAAEYAALCGRLFDAYHATHRALLPHLEARYATQRPRDMPDDQYRRTLRARAFDVARYLLPASTYTGLGYLCSARTLERQIGRLASSPLAEIREIADALRSAAAQPAYNPLANSIQPPLAELLASHPSPEAEALAARVRAAALEGAAAAPTLVRHTEARPYLTLTLEAASAEAQRQLGDTPPDGRRGVELADACEPALEVAATLLYRAHPCSYGQIVACLRSLPPPEVEAIAALAYSHRGPHDEPVREARAGHQLVFDLCLDNGAFRDLHRHRNCVQVIKDLTPSYGYDLPDLLAEAGMADGYLALMDEAGELAMRLDATASATGQYALPLAYRRRALFKMDTVQLGYVVETRTKPAGHFSYREIAHLMLQRFAERYPGLASSVRATDPSIEDFFER
jgi:thymidylate synthase ThyX